MRVKERKKMSICVLFKNWRFNRDINDLSHPFSIVVCKYDKNRNILKLWNSWSCKEDLSIISPLYNNLRTGEKIKFKIKSNLDKIIIVDGKWHYLEKNDKGYFELETIIQSKKGESVIIGKEKPPNSCDYLATYDVI